MDEYGCRNDPQMTARLGSHRPMTEATLHSDARLARRAADGDERAFAAIYRRYHQDLYRFCLSILARPEDAQDALQSTMLKALRALPGEQREIKLKPWLYRIAHNESIELLRKRREELELDPEQVTLQSEPGETAALRERLRRLIADLHALPERQRGALVMRELAGLGFEQIGEALDTSASVARQTVYEARLNLRQLEAGREMRCEEIKRQLSAADGRVTRRRDIQAHLRSCSDCQAFRDAIGTRRQDLAAIAPLPVAAATGILQGLIGSQASAAGGLASAAGVGAGKVAATSVAVKAVATVVVAGAIGVTAADRGGLVDLGLPGGERGGAERREGEAVPGQPGAATPQGAAAVERASAARRAALARRAGARRALRSSGALAGAAGNAAGDTKPSEGSRVAAKAFGKGPPSDLPLAAQRGQQTAAEHKTARGSPPAKGQGQAATNKGEGSKEARGADRQTAKPDRNTNGSSRESAKSKGAAKPAGSDSNPGSPPTGGAKKPSGGAQPPAAAPEPSPDPPADKGLKEPKTSP
jgi:RNA polymerase sigma factor (sigma-70 family)